MVSYLDSRDDVPCRVVCRGVLHYIHIYVGIVKRITFTGDIETRYRH